ncbi:MAG TPA: DNA primase [Acidimicrobiales bacterium]|jgi:DNA primase|nr:DNA primase [Acidimicrobiales bacterium]HWH34673.1 DNA primase [Acidimicrobiales bacterium]
MGILAEDIERVRAATDFVAVAGEHIALRRAGRRWQGLCPFHAEKSPSFSINAEEGLYYCFGCGVGGDVITFVREVEHVDFAEAVERLAARAGIQVRYDTAAVTEERRRRGRLVEAMAQAVEWYHDRLLSGPDAKPARAYLRSRGYDGEIVRTYQLGWAPEGWDELARALKLPEEVLRETGLAFRNKRDRVQDFFRGRVLFPIFDVRGDPVAFGGRRLEGGQGPSGPRSGEPGPKYRNSPETPLYSKSRTLYGLNWAKAAVVETGEVVVCEGYTDVIGLARAGVRTGVATCGTALSDDHIRMLKNFARRLVLAYDADAAGQAAAEKFYEWERRYELDLAVADLPAGMDPGDLARRDPAALQAAVKGARPFLSFRIDRLLARADVRTPGGKAHAAEAALALIREHPSELTRNEYVGRLATVLDMPVDELQRAVHQHRPVRVAQPPRRLEGPEVEALRLAVHRPEEVADRLHDALFADPVVLAGYRALCSATTLPQAIDGAEPEVASLLRRLAVEDPATSPDDVLARLATEAANRAVAALSAEAVRSGQPITDVAWLKLTVAEVQEPATSVDATGRLVRWLVDRFEVEA